LPSATVGLKYSDIVGAVSSIEYAIIYEEDDSMKVSWYQSYPGLLTGLITPFVAYTTSKMPIVPGSELAAGPVWCVED
jgi:hypothetical protein